VEDPLPAYEPIAMNTDDGSPKDPNDRTPASDVARPVTSSLRATNRLLRSNFGFRAVFHGFGYATVLGIASMFALGMFKILLPFSLAHLCSMIVIAPVSTAWVHQIIAAPSRAGESPKCFSSRIRPFRKIYAAAWFPTFLFWAASNASLYVGTLLARVIGLAHPDPQNPFTPVKFEDDDVVIPKAICVVGVVLALQLLLVVPTHTALRRVQASLLPADEDTLVPFDRSFAGRVEPEVVSGRGFATFGAAVKTVPFASWVRIVLLRVKIFFVTMAVYFFAALAVLAQFALLKKADGSA
jgi:hypothetical protein